MEKIIIIFLFVFVSCSSTKKLNRDKNKINKTELNSGELSIKRPSDTLTIDLPKIVYKDTTIYKRGRKSTVYLNYDSKGNAKIISVCDSIQIFKKWYNKTQLSQKEISKEKDKTIEFKPVLILYIFIGLAVLMIINKILNKFI